VSSVVSMRTMADFEIYIDDDRYSVPSLYLITAQSDVTARLTAEELLRSSDHHQGVELRRDGERIYGLGTFGPTAGAADERQDASRL
jgi:hypothetical protein